MRKFYLNFFIVLTVLFFFISCRKEKQLLYEVNDVRVSNGTAKKPNVKNTIEFISIAYSDLFGTTVTNDELVKISTAYAGFGDKKLIEDLIIRNFLNKPGAIIPTKANMRADLGAFANAAYKRLLNRDPDEIERWSLGNVITSDTSITPEMVYYSVMTSNEYRYY